MAKERTDEKLLHYVWRHKLYPLQPLHTTTRQTVEVIDPGLPNTHDAGPDFFNAKLKIDGTLWVGNVEVHVRSSDWMRHGHDRDTAYDNVVLHVVWQADCEVKRTGGEPVPQLELPCPETVRMHYEELQQSAFIPSCYSILGTLPALTVHSWMSALQAERFERKAGDIRTRLEQHDGRWDDVFFITLARNFGFGLNADTFEIWASHLPFRALEKHRDNVQQIEALFYGTAGLLDSNGPEEDRYLTGLKREYAYLARKFDLPAPPDSVRWRMLRLRPGNFPHVRLSQLASLYSKDEPLFSRMLEARTPAEACVLFTAKASEYWETHFTFGQESAKRPKRLGANALNLILINTVVPFLYAYGMHKGNSALCERAASFLDAIKAEDNYIIRQWKAAGLEVKNAADSQALLQLRTMYCDRKDCLRCRFGFEYLRARG